MNDHFDEANEALGLNEQEADLYKRHLSNLHGAGGVDNPDGSRSSLYQAVQEHNGAYYNIPTVWNGKREVEKWTRPSDGKTFDVPNATALKNVEKEGWERFPSYKTSDEADDRYDKMHGFMERDTEDYHRGVRPMAMAEPPVIGNRADVQAAVRTAGRGFMEPFDKLGRVITGQSEHLPTDIAGAALGLAPIGPPGAGKALVSGAQAIESAIARTAAQGTKAVASGIADLPRKIHEEMLRAHGSKKIKDIKREDFDAVIAKAMAKP